MGPRLLDAVRIAERSKLGVFSRLRRAAGPDLLVGLTQNSGVAVCVCRGVCVSEDTEGPRM